jgi:hypothetical protein
MRTLIKYFFLTYIAFSLGSAALEASPPVVMKVLVLAGNSNETGYQAITTYLAEIGVPYQAVLLSTVSPDPSGNRMPEIPLSDAASGRGLYQGIILTNSTLSGCGTSSCLSAADWNTLNAYASQFKVRMVSYYTVPSAQWGLAAADSGALYTASTPLNVTLTEAGAATFSYLNAANPIPVSGQGTSGIRVYRATAVAASDETTTPLLVAGTYTVAVTHTTADGRETMALTMDNQPGLLHSEAFGYGVINWVTKGVFLGSRRIYFNPQVDDLLLGNWLYAPQLHPSCEPGNSCPTYFMSGPDLQAHANWQASLKSDPQFQSYQGTFAYNGIGSTWYDPNDPVFATMKSVNSQFWWLSHTWDHTNLDCFTVNSRGNCVPATLAQSLSELNENIDVAPNLGITLDTQAMVTPFNSGLQNANFMQAAAQVGIKYIVFPQYPDSPNTGIVSTYQPSILIIPRFNNNLFDDVSSPYTGVYGSWPDEYNAMYGPNGDHTYAQNQTYSQILDHESQNFLQNYMLTYAPYLLAFHIANTATYDGIHSIYSDLVDATVAKYKKLFTLPVITLNTEAIGELLKDRASYDASGVVGVYTPGVSIVLTTTKAASIPVTGACAQTVCGTYGGQIQDNVQMAANSTVTLSLSASEGVIPLSVSINPSSVTAGSSATGTVTLSGPAPTGGLLVSLSSSVPTAAGVPPTITVAGGSTTATFSVTTMSVTSSTTVSITASANGVSEAGTLTITPVQTVALSSLSVSSDLVVSGDSLTGTVTLTGTAPVGGVSVSLTSSNPAATVPVSVTVAAGSTSAVFTVNTNNVAYWTGVQLTSTYNGVTKTADFTVRPAATVDLVAVSLNQTSVKGGTTLTGTVTLSAAAPPGGMPVELWTTGTCAFVPSIITVPAGSTTGTFSVATIVPSTTLQDTVTAFYNGTVKTVQLTVTP